MACKAGAPSGPFVAPVVDGPPWSVFERPSSLVSHFACAPFGLAGTPVVDDSPLSVFSDFCPGAALCVGPFRGVRGRLSWTALHGLSSTGFCPVTYPWRHSVVAFGRTLALVSHFTSAPLGLAEAPIVACPPLSVFDGFTLVRPSTFSTCPSVAPCLRVFWAFEGTCLWWLPLVFVYRHICA